MPSSLSTTRPNSVGEARLRYLVWWVVAIGLVVVALDQLSKWQMMRLMPAKVVEVTGFFNFVQVCNTGISFGLMPGESTLKPWILSAFAAAVVIGLLIWVRRKDSLLLMAGSGLVVGGALGNVVDRLRLGCVIDFIDVHAAGWHWPAFNLADSAITVGVALLLVHGLFFEPTKGK
jgi:signal peptidase II